MRVDLTISKIKTVAEIDSYHAMAVATALQTFFQRRRLREDLDWWLFEFAHFEKDGLTIVRSVSPDGDAPTYRVRFSPVNPSQRLALMKALAKKVRIPLM